MSDKRSVGMSLKASLVDWVDGKVIEGIWRNRTHAFERLVMMGQAREARGEDLTIINFPQGANIDVELSYEGLQWAREQAKKEGKSLNEFMNDCVREVIGKDTG